MPAEPRQAASLLVVRDSAGGPEIYMVRRHARSRFMANALVFVGGRVDEADRCAELLARCSGLQPGEAARRLGIDAPAAALGYYVAALRECFEESGLLLADGELPDPSEHAELRRRLNEGDAPFAELLTQHGLTLPLDRLRYLDHWITPEFEHRRYDTRFFICRAPQGQLASFDPKETSFGDWLTVPAVLEGNVARTLHLAPPTLVILEGLRGCATADDMLACAPDQPVAHTMPKPLLGRTELPTLLLPGDHRYDVPESTEGPVHCVELRDTTWVRTRS